MSPGVRVTTNPTIFARSIADSGAYAGQVHDLQVRQTSPDQALRELTAFDVRWLPDVRRDRWGWMAGVDRG